MTSLYLIAHKVRKEPAFDIAKQVSCCVCNADQNIVDFVVPKKEDCDNCDGEGFEWIIPTSGHRAHPWWNMNLGALMFDTDRSANLVCPERLLDAVPEMPIDWPDHYAINDRRHKSEPSVGLLANIVKGLKKPQPKIVRRV